MLLVILASLLPGLFWLWYFNRYDVNDREPLGLLLLCMLFGALAVVPALSLEAPFKNYLQSSNPLIIQFALSFIVVGLTEEVLKFFAVYLAAGKSQEFTEPMDGIIYAIATAIGFSVVENILYISAFGLFIAPLRGTLATLAHIGFSGLAGYFWGRYKCINRSKGEIVLGIFLAVFLHGLYDFLLITHLASPLILLLFILGIHFLLLQAIKKAVSHS